MTRVTIEDISRQTGLSRGTVSRALNDRPDISEQTKQRVLEACRQLHYVPSHAARALATGRRFAVGVLVDDLRSACAAGFLRGVLVRARSQRYAVHVSEVGSDRAGALEHLGALASERVDSVLLATPIPAEAARQLADALDDRPLVAICPIEGIPCDVLAPDCMEAGRLVADHILQDGRSPVAYVYEAGAESVAALEGFGEVCRRHQIDPRTVAVEVRGDGAERLEPVRSRLPGLKAIAASNDFLAIELMLMCVQAGRIPGQDIGIVGQGNDLAGAKINPSLSTIDYCGEEIGRRAMEVALQRAAGTRQDAPQHTLVPPVLVARASTRLLR